jgi:hypothetical protein
MLKKLVAAFLIASCSFASAQGTLPTAPRFTTPSTGTSDTTAATTGFVARDFISKAAPTIPSFTTPGILTNDYGGLLTNVPRVGTGITGAALAGVQAYGGKLLISTRATDNAIVGAVVQDGSNGNSFPTGITGYGYLGNPGNTVFGGFFQVDCRSVGACIGAEFNTFNYQANANATFPPLTNFGTTSPEPITQQVVAYGTYRSKIGTYYSSGTGGQGFVAGIYMNPFTASNYGVFVDADSTHGAATAGTFKTVGNVGDIDLNLQFGTTAPQTASFIEAYNGGGLQFKVNSYGEITARDLTLTIVPTSAGAGGLYLCVDSAGVTYKKSSCP